MKKWIMIMGIVFIAIFSLLIVQMNSSPMREEGMGNIGEGQVGDKGELTASEKKILDEKNVERTDLFSVGDYEGDAMATRSFNGERFFHTVTANISDPSEGKFYEGWLVDGSDFFSTGKMIKRQDQYYLEYFSDDDQRSFNNVVITEETEADGLDNNPEAHVLEGAF